MLFRSKRVSQNSRIFIPYDIVTKNNLTIQQLDTYNKSICVGINYSKYEELLHNENNNELDDYFHLLTFQTPIFTT